MYTVVVFVRKCGHGQPMSNRACRLHYRYPRTVPPLSVSIFPNSIQSFFSSFCSRWRDANICRYPRMPRLKLALLNFEREVPIAQCRGGDLTPSRIDPYAMCRVYARPPRVGCSLTAWQPTPGGWPVKSSCVPCGSWERDINPLFTRTRV